MTDKLERVDRCLRILKNASEVRLSQQELEAVSGEMLLSSMRRPGVARPWDPSSQTSSRSPAPGRLDRGYPTPPAKGGYPLPAASMSGRNGEVLPRAKRVEDREDLRTKRNLLTSRVTKTQYVEAKSRGAKLSPLQKKTWKKKANYVIKREDPLVWF